MELLVVTSLVYIPSAISGAYVKLKIDIIGRCNRGTVTTEYHSNAILLACGIIVGGTESNNIFFN